jgi:phenylpyruvate tautomerase PptA (4-oxalocrotonate tautomerase family)
MPLYEVETASGELKRSTKADIAAEITDIHCRLTGAPAAFVNVVFREYADGDCFVARRPTRRSSWAASGTDAPSTYVKR